MDSFARRETESEYESANIDVACAWIDNGMVFIFGIVLKITSFIEHEMHTFNINLAHTTHTHSTSSLLWL